MVHVPKLHNVFCIFNWHDGCKTRSHTLKEEYTLRVFDNRVLRRIIGPKMEEVAEAGKIA
jgi:hypothetical protein